MFADIADNPGAGAAADTAWLPHDRHERGRDGVAAVSLLVTPGVHRYAAFARGVSGMIDGETPPCTSRLQILPSKRALTATPPYGETLHV